MALQLALVAPGSWMVLNFGDEKTTERMKPFLHFHGRINDCQALVGRIGKKRNTLHRPSSLLDNQSTIAMIFFPMLRPRWLKMGI